jgi:hypothetical protein
MPFEEPDDQYIIDDDEPSLSNQVSSINRKAFKVIKVDDVMKSLSKNVDELE